MIFYSGSYTQKGAPSIKPEGAGIGCFELNKETGSIKLLRYTDQRNPSYLVISKDKNYLYAIEEMFESLNPKIFSYRIMDYGKLELINSQQLSGDYACHLAIIDDRLVVANYVSGDALSFPILEDGSLAPYHQIIKHTGTGPNKERQEAPHMHMVKPFKGRNMFLVDLGIDMAKAYQLNNRIKKWNAVPELDIKIESGAGARHLVMDETQRYVFVLGELTGDVFVLKNENKGFKQVQKISSLPEKYDKNFGGAAIRLHPQGQFLYTSVRGSDTITVFKVNNETKKLTLIDIQSVEGETPRDFNIDPTGKWLLVANQESNSLVVFKIDLNTGRLIKKNKKKVKTPVNITWLST
jgi:6-phosphogluconolactonase